MALESEKDSPIEARSGDRCCYFMMFNPTEKWNLLFATILYFVNLNRNVIDQLIVSDMHDVIAQHDPFITSFMQDNHIYFCDEGYINGENLIDFASVTGAMEFIQNFKQYETKMFFWSNNQRQNLR